MLKYGLWNKARRTHRWPTDGHAVFLERPGRTHNTPHGGQESGPGPRARGSRRRSRSASRQIVAIGQKPDARRQDQNSLGKRDHARILGRNCEESRWGEADHGRGQTWETAIKYRVAPPSLLYEIPTHTHTAHTHTADGVGEEWGGLRGSASFLHSPSLQRARSNPPALGPGRRREYSRPTSRKLAGAVGEGAIIHGLPGAACCSLPPSLPPLAFPRARFFADASPLSSRSHSA